MIRKEVIGNATLYLGDCLEVLPTLPKVDAVVTDPPYGIGAGDRTFKSGTRKREASYAYGSWDNERPDVSFLLGYGRYHLIWGGQYFANKLPIHDGWLTWCKRSLDGNFTNDERSYATTELAWRDWGKANFMSQVWDGGMRAGSADNRTFCHPSQKPVELMAWCLRQLPSDAKLIVDPFMGSGTTGVAAAQLGLDFIGIEREPQYFEVACRRIDRTQQQGSLFGREQAKPEQSGLEFA